MVATTSGASRVLICILLAASVAAVTPLVQGAQGDGVANVAFEADVPAPVHALATSQDGAQVAVIDDQGRFTIIADEGETIESWTPPRAGMLSLLDPSLGEVPPHPVGIAISSTGDHWGGAVAYEQEHPGQVFGFAGWSDAPAWTFTLDGPTGAAADADQPTVVTSGGPYYGIGTAQGKVYLLKTTNQGGQTQTAYRTYDQGNHGEPFQRIDSLALSGDGKTTLIGTGRTDGPSLHVFSDTFFQATFKRITSPVVHVALSDDAHYGMAITGQGPATRAHYLDIRNATVLWETTLGATVTSIAMDADGDVIVIGEAGGRVAIFEHTGNMDDRTPSHSHHLGSRITGVATDATGWAIAATTEEGKGYLLNRDAAQPLWAHDAGRPLSGTSLSTDGEVLVFAARGDDGRVIYTEAEHTIDQATAPRPKARPGEASPITIDVANNGNRAEALTARWTSIPSDWTSDGATLALMPGDAGRVSPTITPPSGQAAGQYAARIVLDHGGGQIPVDLTIDVPEITSGQARLVWSIDAVVPGGAPAAFIYRLENTGNTVNQVQVGYAEVPPEWKVEFDGATEFHMQPGTTRDVVFKVHAPFDAPLTREASFDLLVVWQQGEERIPITLQPLDGQLYRDRVLRAGNDEGGADPTRDRLIQELGSIDPSRPSTPDVASTESKDSPAGGIALTALVIMGLAGRLRRRC